MDFSVLLNDELIQIGHESYDKEAVLECIAKLARRSPTLADYSEEDIFQALANREKLSSTGFGQRIAIPHCSFKELPEFVVGMLIVPHGADFEALDGQKTNLFVFIIAPESRRNDHIRLLSGVSRVLHNAKAVDEILGGSTPENVREIFCRHAGMHVSAGEHEEYSLIHVLLQDEKFFEEVLPVFAELDDSSVSIIEGANASSFLQRVPLYASFWHTESKSFHRIVIAIVKRHFSNEVIRQINTIAGNLGKESGFLVFVQDLDHVSGCLDF